MTFVVRRPRAAPDIALKKITCPGGLSVEPTRLFPIIVLFSLVTVEYGGWALLGFLTGRGTLGAFRTQFFRAGHAHAGVLLVLSLVYFVYLGRAGYSTPVQWLAGALLLAGVLAQSGGFFVHLGMGGEGLGRHRTDPGRGPADRRGPDHPGHRPDQDRMKGGKAAPRPGFAVRKRHPR
jgi:hypothetical protein